MFLKWKWECRRMSITFTDVTSSRRKKLYLCLLRHDIISHCWSYHILVITILVRLNILNKITGHITVHHITSHHHIPSSHHHITLSHHITSSHHIIQSHHITSHLITLLITSPVSSRHKNKWLFLVHCITSHYIDYRNEKDDGFTFYQNVLRSEIVSKTTIEEEVIFFVMTVRVFLAIFFSHFCLMPNLVKRTCWHRCWHLFRYGQFTLHDSLACMNSSNGPFHLHGCLDGHRISNASTFFLAAWSAKTSFGFTSW